MKHKTNEPMALNAEKDAQEHGDAKVRHMYPDMKHETNKSAVVNTKSHVQELQYTYKL